MSSALDYTRGTNATLARGYQWVDESNSPVPESRVAGSARGHYVPESYMVLSCISGAGATICSVNDYISWIKAFTDTADPLTLSNESSPITPNLYNSVLKPETILNRDGSAKRLNDFDMPGLYSAGWSSFVLDNHTAVYHDGGVIYFGTKTFFLVDDGYGIFTMENTAGSSNIVGGMIAAELLSKRFRISKKEQATHREVVH